jgi:hypothetical protein
MNVNMIQTAGASVAASAGASSVVTSQAGLFSHSETPSGAPTNSTFSAHCKERIKKQNLKYLT